jgi:hypothetical protein
MVKIPFTDFALEIKPLLSGVNITFELENIRSSIVDAIDDITDVVGQDIYDKAIVHYEDTTNYNQDDETDPRNIRLNDLVYRVQDSLINFAIYRHFIWLVLRIGNDGVTVKKNDSETTAYKYLTDEAKDALINSAWSKTSKLINFLNQQATAITIWAANTAYTTVSRIYVNSKFYKCTIYHTSGESFVTDNWEEIFIDSDYVAWVEDNLYAVDAKIYQGSKYYKCTTEHTSGEAFVADNWEEVAAADVIVFSEWTLSEEFTESKQILFNDYKEFGKYYEIDKSAYFFMKIRLLIKEVLYDEVYALFEDANTLFANRSLPANTELITRILRFTAHRVMALACFRFAYHELPSPIRKDIDNEQNRKNKDTNDQVIKEKISILIDRKADMYKIKVQHYLETQLSADTTADEQPVQAGAYTLTEPITDDKFYLPMM